MLAYNVAASKMARPTCRFLSSSTSFDWHQGENGIRNLENATRDKPSIRDGPFCGCRDAQRKMKLNV